MATAFQASAFQNNAFQIDGDAPQPQPQAPDAGGAGSLGRRGSYSTKLWRKLRAREAWRRTLECALQEHRKGRREALDRAAEAAAEALRGVDIVDAEDFSLLAEALIEACKAKTVADTVIWANRVVAIATDLIESEDEDEEALIMALLQDED